MAEPDEGLKLPINPDDTSGLRVWLEFPAEQPSHVTTLRMWARSPISGEPRVTQQFTLNDRDWCNVVEHWEMTRWKDEPTPQTGGGTGT